jgi:hypothetical protein
MGVATRHPERWLGVTRGHPQWHLGVAFTSIGLLPYFILFFIFIYFENLRSSL